MEPMDSNVLMEKLGITIKVAKLDKHKGVSLAAKRRKTASGFKVENKSDHENEGKMKMNENDMKIDIQKINLPATGNSSTTESGNKTRKRARPGALDDSLTSRVVKKKRQESLREASHDKSSVATLSSVSGFNNSTSIAVAKLSNTRRKHREISLAMYPREFQDRQTSNFAKRGSALQKDETHDRRTA
ncbi:hypothetical protein Plhal710r2_c083g0181101 [Plasmopara halstedii]